MKTKGEGEYSFHKMQFSATIQISVKVRKSRLLKQKNKHCINGFKCYQLTQAKGLRQSIDISSHRLCFDHTAGQRECIPFWNQINYH